MQPRNIHYSGAQGVISLEGSSATPVREVEGVAQPAGCSTSARAQEDGPVIWEALTVLHRRVRGSGERGEPQLVCEAVRGVGGPNKSVDLGERCAPGPRRAKAARAGVNFRGGNMTDALTSLGMSTGLRKVAERARREPAAQFHSLAHLIDAELLVGAFARLRSDAAVGVDGITKEQYGQDLESNLKGLHERLKTKRYRHQPIRRVHIPKEKQGQSRPIGVSATEDKVVQNECARCWRWYTSRTSWTAPTAFAPDAVRTMPCER